MSSDIVALQINSIQAPTTVLDEMKHEIHAEGSNLAKWRSRVLQAHQQDRANMNGKSVGIFMLVCLHNDIQDWYSVVSTVHHLLIHIKQLYPDYFILR